MCKASKDIGCKARSTTMEAIETSCLPPDFISSDFLSLCKKYVGGWHFRTDGKLQQANLTLLHDHDADFDRLVYGWNKCFGKYSVFVVKQ
ncbi:hypothetical protein AVEN_108727-1 [Araneus ventricosus]|uniref:Uncharacterized protein n=1 Tax=Araneus ventricosus TaxID=182803 RepID=A0A4Y2WTK5_ARAVE|nr:hypothetical protein AVEN_108727-1 [Araneus ventricosus]